VELSKLVFWNLVGGRAGFEDADTAADDSTTPKPVTAEDVGVSLVSGYSQAMMKIFLNGGQFEDAEEDEEVADAEIYGGEEGMTAVTKTKKTKIGPPSTVKKANSHMTFLMLELVD